jgi:hypothetical protein
MMTNRCKAIMLKIQGLDDNEGERYGVRGQPTNIGYPTAALCSG